MAALTTIALIGVAVAAVGTYQSIQAQQDAKKDARRQRDANQKINDQQRADAAGKAAAERRQQIREERIRRARVIASSENTGVEGSSGEIGAVSSLSTNLSTNIGANAASVFSGGLISQYAQDAANAGYSMQSNLSRAQNASTVAGFGGSIFNAAGGMGAFSSASGGTGVDNSIFGTAGSGSRGMGD